MTNHQVVRPVLVLLGRQDVAGDPFLARCRCCGAWMSPGITGAVLVRNEHGVDWWLEAVCRWCFVAHLELAGLLPLPRVVEAAKHPELVGQNYFGRLPRWLCDLGYVRNTVWPVSTGCWSPLFSNFEHYPKPLHFAAFGLSFHARSGEHAFQAFKATNEADRSRILAAPTPADAKRAGRRVALVPGWEPWGSVLAMAAVLRTRVAYQRGLREVLLGTDGADIIEVNRWGDRKWGAVPRADGTAEGANLLGQLLMRERRRLGGTS